MPSWAKWHGTLLAIVLPLTALASATTSWAAATFTFTNIADTSTVAPGAAGGTFSAFEMPSISGSTVAFVASPIGIYTGDGTTISVLANTLSPAPLGGLFTSFGSAASIDSATVAFRGTTSVGATGIYIAAPGGGGTLLTRLVAVSDPAPAGGTFTSLERPSIDSATVAFRGTTSVGATGIYTAAPGGGGTLLTRLVAVSDPAPAGGTFTSLGQAFIDGGTVAFRGTTSLGATGIYTAAPGGGGTLLTRLVAVSDPAPAGGTFTSLGEPSFDAGTVAFFATTSLGASGIYTAALSGGGTVLTVRADTSTLIPSGVGTFTSFGDPAIDGGNVAFIGNGNLGQLGLYVAFNGDLAKVVDLDDALFGKVPQSLGFFGEGLSGTALAFSAQFTDGSQAIVQADSRRTSPIPEPATLLLLIAGFSAAVFAKRSVRKNG